MLNLLEGNVFRDAAAASRAVRCLAYLVEGHDGASEPECVLPKLLCGIPLSAPLVGRDGSAAPGRAGSRAHDDTRPAAPAMPTTGCRITRRKTRWTMLPVGCWTVSWTP